MSSPAFLRFVIFSDTHGIYLGHHFGVPFWSMKNPGPKKEAPTFANDEEADMELAHLDDEDKPPFRLIQVYPDNGSFASEEACVNSNQLPRWLK